VGFLVGLLFLEVGFLNKNGCFFGWIQLHRRGR